MRASTLSEAKIKVELTLTTRDWLRRSAGLLAVWTWGTLSSLNLNGRRAGARDMTLAAHPAEYPER